MLIIIVPKLVYAQNKINIEPNYLYKGLTNI